MPFCRTEALKTALTLIDNVIKLPGDLKRRSIRLGNATFHSRLGRYSGGIGILKAVGFAEVLEAGVPHLNLSPAVESLEKTIA